jgi:hypothetical protein
MSHKESADSIGCSNMSLTNSSANSEAQNMEQV